MLYIRGVRIITFFIFLFFSILIVAQIDTGNAIKSPLKISLLKKDSLNKHSPKKATVLSAILPGAGQVYNHQAWKVVVLYGGLAALGYFVNYNNGIYKDYLQQWKYLTDNDSTTNVRPSLSLASPDALHTAFSDFRKYRDQCIIGFALLYVANIIDANVYAHLYHFNVDDLSLHFTPGYNISTHTLIPSARLVFKF